MTLWLTTNRFAKSLSKVTANPDAALSAIVHISQFSRQSAELHRRAAGSTLL